MQGQITGIVGLNKQTGVVVLNSDMTTQQIKNLLVKVIEAIDQQSGHQLFIHEALRS